MFGVLGNFFLTFNFAFLLVLTGLNLDKKFQIKIHLFKYLSYIGILIYFIIYFKFMTTIHYSFFLGYFIMSFGIYEAIRFSKK